MICHEKVNQNNRISHFNFYTVIIQGLLQTKKRETI